MSSCNSDAAALNALNNLWYIVAERIFQRVVAVTGLDKKQAEALREVALRPALFEVVVEETPEPCPRTSRDAVDSPIV
jgi:hypothetical protein